VTSLVAPRRRAESVGAAALAAAAILLYVPVMRDLFLLWRDVPYYSYGFLVPVFSAYLAWDARRVVAASLPVPAPVGLVMLGAGLATLALGGAAGSLSARTLSMPVVALGVVMATQGIARARALGFAIGFLALMTPLPDGAIPALSLPLQRLAAVVAEHALRVLGIHVVRHDLFLALPGVTLHVTEACNGLRFLLAMIVVGIAFAGTTQRRALTRAGVIVAALAVAIVANLVRVTGTGVLAVLWGPAAALGMIHLAWGKLVYAMMLVPFAAVVLFLRRR
jgi:exosortase